MGTGGESVETEHRLVSITNQCEILILRQPKTQIRQRTNHPKPISHIQIHLRSQIIRVKVMNTEDGVSGGVLRVDTGDVGEFEGGGAGVDGLVDPAGEDGSVVFHFVGEDGTAGGVELGSPAEGGVVVLEEGLGKG